MVTDKERMLNKEQEDRDYHEALGLGADAVLKIRNAAEMSEEKKLQVAEWLRNHAEDLLAQGHEYSVLFTGRFNPEEGREVD